MANLRAEKTGRWEKKHKQRHGGDNTRSLGDIKLRVYLMVAEGYILCCWHGKRTVESFEQGVDITNVLECNFHKGKDSVFLSGIIHALNKAWHLEGSQKAFAICIISNYSNSILDRDGLPSHISFSTSVKKFFHPFFYSRCNLRVSETGLQEC